MYARFWKRIFDVTLSFGALLILSPFLLILTFLTAIAMKGNPFFVQERPGKNEKIFALLKFRTMTNERDEKGTLLPDEDRLNRFGRFLRSSSLDELPELINIFIGNMSIIGPRPLLVKYLPLYNTEQRRRHEVRPGLTGLAQANGRNALSWEEKFALDVEYVDGLSFKMDLSIFWHTIKAVIKREGISQDGHATMEEFKGTNTPVVYK